jgi:hypothetical protein
MVLMSSDDLKEFLRRGIAAQKAANELIREWHERETMMPFPATREAMEAAGYKRSSYTRCSGCGESIEFWTTPAGKQIPMNFMAYPDTPAVSHFVTCPKATQFKRKTRPGGCQDAPADPRRP